MRLTVLGCSGTYPTPASACSGYLVEHDGFRLVLDLGNGALGELQSHCDLLAVDAVWITHLHADHCLDLLPYSYARRYHPDGVPPPLPVHGPPGLRRRILGAYEAPPDDGLEAVFRFVEAGPGRARLGPLTVTTCRVEHPVDAHAVRVEADGRSLVYSGDTAPSGALVALATDCDVLLCEASWPSTPAPPPGIHLTGAEAGEHAAAAGVRRLLLTHLMPFADPAGQLADAREHYPGPAEVVRPGASYDV